MKIILLWHRLLGIQAHHNKLHRLTEQLLRLQRVGFDAWIRVTQIEMHILPALQFYVEGQL